MKYIILVALVVGLALAPGASAWTTSSYRGHGTGYYTINGVEYKMVYDHRHVVHSSVCQSNDYHHYRGYKKGGGVWYRLGAHDHHRCGAEHSWPPETVVESESTHPPIES